MHFVVISTNKLFILQKLFPLIFPRFFLHFFLLFLHHRSVRFQRILISMICEFLPLAHCVQIVWSDMRLVLSLFRSSVLIYKMVHLIYHLMCLLLTFPYICSRSLLYVIYLYLKKKKLFSLCCLFFKL